MNRSFDLIIFDCDGVLVDSERVANEVFARVLDEVCDLQFTLEDMFDTLLATDEPRRASDSRKPSSVWRRLKEK